MKIFLKKLLLFTFYASAIIASIISVFGKYDNTDRYTSKNPNIYRLNIVSNYDNLDILFLGNSHCYSGIIPRMLDSIGVNSYNLGIATAGISFYEIIINDYLLNVNTPPQNIFIYLGPLTFSSKSDNYIKYPIHRYLDNPISNIEVVLNYKLYKNPSFKN